MDECLFYNVLFWILFVPSALKLCFHFFHLVRPMHLLCSLIAFYIFLFRLFLLLLYYEYALSGMQNFHKWLYNYIFILFSQFQIVFTIFALFMVSLLIIEIILFSNINFLKLIKISINDGLKYFGLLSFFDNVLNIFWVIALRFLMLFVWRVITLIAIFVIYDFLLSHIVIVGCENLYWFIVVMTLEVFILTITIIHSYILFHFYSVAD
jgi:hypothetical protein